MIEAQVAPYLDVPARALELGCDVPTGIAILPRNFETAESRGELIHEDETITLRSLWRQAKVVETRLEGEGKKFPSIQEKSIEWIAPTIFISASLLSQNAGMVNIALNVLSNYITEVLKGFPGNHTVTLNFVTDDIQQNRFKTAC